MRTPRSILALSLMILTLIFQGGCQNNKNWFKPKNPSAVGLIDPATPPTLESLTTAINKNSMSIRNISTEDASIVIPGVMFQLRSRITFERPKRLRVQASVGLTGQELDFGSNDTMFWLWVRRMQGEMWYCRHDQFPTCPLRGKVPIDPDWIMEAIGIVEFLPTDRHSGPYQTADGNLMIETRKQTAAGIFVKKTTIGVKTGWVLRQEMYSPQNELVAIAVSHDHRKDQATGIIYAQRVEVQCQGAEGKMSIDLGTPKFNGQHPFASTMFAMPTIDGYRAIDLCSPEFLQRGMGAMTGVGATPSVQAAPGHASQPPIPTSGTAVPSDVPLNSGPYSIPNSVVNPAATTDSAPVYYYDHVTPEASKRTVVR